MFFSPDFSSLEGGGACRQLPAAEDAGTLRDVHAHTLVVECLAVRTVAALHAVGLTGVAIGDVAARAFAGVTAHLVRLASRTLQH